jgi:hypothetical protein
MSASSTTSTFEWTLERFPDLRLASAIVESPRTVLASIFGVPANDLPADIADVATYDTVFETAQKWVVVIEKALIAAASEAVHTVVERIEATQRLHELALYDAQLVVLHLAGELLYHAYCRNDPKSADLLKSWAPEQVWEFLDLNQALRAESDLQGWKQDEFSPSSAAPPTPQAAIPKLMAVPLRTTAAILSLRGTTPFREQDWFYKSTSTALAVKVNQRLEKVKLSLTRLIMKGTPEVSGAAGTSAVDIQLSEQAGIATPEPGSNADSGSESEPEDSGVRDPLDPEPNFRRHPNAWRLWVARAERRRAEKASGPAAGATASSAERGDRPSTPTKPPLPKSSNCADGEVERFIRQLADYFCLTRVTDDLDMIHTAGMLCDGKAGRWYETYRLKIDRNMAMCVLGKWVEDPIIQTWEHFEATLRDSHGGWRLRQTNVNKWNALRQTGGIDAFLDEVTRLMRVMDYPNNVVKDKLRDGLKKDLRREWTKVRPKPAYLSEQIALLRDLSHADEDFDREEADRSRDQGCRDGRRHEGRDQDHRSDTPARRRDDRRPGNGKSNPRPDKSRSEKHGKHASSSSRPGRERGFKPSGSSSSFQQSTQGIDSEVITNRRKNSDCLKCGKSGHSWNDCWAKEPNGSSRSSDFKRKNDRDDSQGGSSFEKSRPAAAAATVSSEPGRIIEIPEDEAEDLDYDIWA